MLNARQPWHFYVIIANLKKFLEDIDTKLSTVTFTMKTLVHLAIAASLAIGVTANSHQHLHRHIKKDVGSKAEKRVPDPVTAWVAGPTQTVYQLDGKILDADKAQAGLEDGELVVVGETTPTYTPPPPPPKPTTTSVKNFGAQFLEKSSSAPPPPKPTTTSQPPPPPKSTKAAPKPSTPSGGTGLNAKFPSGTVPCSQFPSDYGPISVPYLGMNGYIGLQFVPGFSLKTSLSISTIITGISGDKCKEGTMCSYACPVGYQKTQWSSQQGSTKQSVGGLYCNSDGFLELTRPSYPTLCEPGMGGVTIQNDLSVVVSTCRTDYPGSESMTVPAEAQAGESIPLTNPNQATYYQWAGLATSAQYYVNKKGVSASEGCRWNCANDPLGCGNWAPINIGAGVAADGTTFLSIFQNAPTSTAKLDFNIEITGDVNSKCGYKNGAFIGGDSGCTVSLLCI